MEPQETTSDLAIFNFEGHEVRFVGTADKPEWVAQDVCNILDIAEAKSSMRDFNDYEKGVHSMHTLGGSQEMLTVTEPGLYRLIFKSRKEVAKRFQQWVFHDVLPSVRKTGLYSIPNKQEPITKPQTEPGLYPSDF